MANPHRSLLSTLTSVEETHAPRYRCTTAIRFSSYSHCLQTTKLKVTPNKKILEKNLYPSKQKQSWLLQLVLIPLKNSICTAQWFPKYRRKKIADIGEECVKKSEKKADHMISPFTADRAFYCLCISALKLILSNTSKSKPISAQHTV